jgi:hypothetical protein
VVAAVVAKAAAGHTVECMVMVTSIIDLREDSSIGDYLITSTVFGVEIGVGAAMATLGTAATTLL